MDLRLLLLYSIFLPSVLGYFRSSFSDDVRFLLEFKKGILSDPSGLILSSWIQPRKSESNYSATSAPACPSSWCGVSCDASGTAVVAVSLDGLGLEGEIKFATLAGMRSLSNLSLSGNFLTGRLVPALGSLASLPEDGEISAPKLFSFSFGSASTSSSAAPSSISMRMPFPSKHLPCASQPSPPSSPAFDIGSRPCSSSPLIFSHAPLIAASFRSPDARLDHLLRRQSSRRLPSSSFPPSTSSSDTATASSSRKLRPALLHCSTPHCKVFPVPAPPFPEHRPPPSHRRNISSNAATSPTADGCSPTSPSEASPLTASSPTSHSQSISHPLQSSTSLHRLCSHFLFLIPMVYIASWDEFVERSVQLFRV